MAGVVLAFAVVSTFVAILNRRHTPRDAHPASSPTPPPAHAAERVTENLPLQRGDTLDGLLARAGFDPGDRLEIIAAIRAVFDVKKLRAGSEITLTRSPGGPPESLAYVIDPDHRLELSRPNGPFRAAVVEVPGEVRVQPVCGTMLGSLFESIERVGAPAELAMRVADIFAWDLDFYTDPQPGDEFCLVVEKKEYSNGQPPRYSRILAARYENAGTVYEGFLFPDRAGKPRYYAADGRSLQAAFLRSPLKFDARVSSGFSRRRFHPVLKIYRPHLGTDYAAPVGAPVQAVAAGRVIFSGRAGGRGNVVRIQHANEYESLYMHLSRRYVRAGQKVVQGQRIAAVGATGLATGPHLDFRLQRNGEYVNFEHFRPPRATQLDPNQMQAFAAGRQRYQTLMNGGAGPVASAVAPVASRVTESAEGGNGRL